VRFLVIAGSVEPFDMSKVGDAPLRSNRYRADLLARGKIESHAHIAGNRAHMWIFDVDSVDELDEIMANDPMSAFFAGRPEIYPLTSYERMADRERLIEELLGPRAG
jgi:muconolactone delta-isomerase